MDKLISRKFNIDIACVELRYTDENRGIVTYNPLPYFHQIKYNYEKYLIMEGDICLCIQKNFGARVQQLRKETGMSQERFALSINMDRTYLASVEAGKRNISLSNIEKIAKGLNITLSELFKEL